MEKKIGCGFASRACKLTHAGKKSPARQTRAQKYVVLPTIFLRWSLLKMSIPLRPSIVYILLLHYLWSNAFGPSEDAQPRGPNRGSSRPLFRRKSFNSDQNFIHAAPAEQKNIKHNPRNQCLPPPPNPPIPEHWHPHPNLHPKIKMLIKLKARELEEKM